MTDLTILLVDDEPPARNKLRAYLGDESGIAVILEADNGPEAVRLIQEKRPDLVFLDIQMPGMNGLEVIETVGPEHMPVVVFVTAYDQYALAAFEVEALDYLLKPFDQERFKKTFHRMQEQIRLQTGNAVPFEKLIAALRQEPSYLDRIMVNVGPRYFFVNTQDVLYISASEKYVVLHTDAKTYLLRETMQNLEQRLDPAHFARIHRSYIVNLNCIRELTPSSHGDYFVRLVDGTRLNLSRRYRDRVFRRP